MGTRWPYHRLRYQETKSTCGPGDCGGQREAWKARPELLKLDGSRARRFFPRISPWPISKRRSTLPCCCPPKLTPIIRKKRGKKSSPPWETQCDKEKDIYSFTKPVTPVTARLDIGRQDLPWWRFKACTKCCICLRTKIVHCSCRISKNTGRRLFWGAASVLRKSL